MTIGNRMKIRRKELGLTQKELASEVKLSQNYLSELEKDKFNPTAPIIIRLAVALKISADELLGMNEEKIVFVFPVLGLLLIFPCYNPEAGFFLSV